MLLRVIQPNEVAAAFARFDPLWNAMSLQEQNDLLRLLIERVDFDGPSGEIQLQLHPDGIQALIDQNRDTP
jgi:site-specific DNA recombinase